MRRLPTDKGSEEPAPPPELKNRHPRDIAEEMRDLPLARIRDILRKLPDGLAAEVISELPQDVQVRLFESMQVSSLSGIVGEMFSDDVADVTWPCIKRATARDHERHARRRRQADERSPEISGG